MFKNAAIFSRFVLVFRPHAFARAMTFSACADVVQPDDNIMSLDEFPGADFHEK